VGVNFRLGLKKSPRLSHAKAQVYKKLGLHGYDHFFFELKMSDMYTLPAQKMKLQ